MSRLHPVANLILESLAPGRGPGVTFALRKGAARAIAAAMKNAIAAKDGPEAQRDALATIALLQREPSAREAVDELLGFVAEFDDDASVDATERDEDRVHRVRTALSTKLGRTAASGAVAFDAPAPEGTIKHRDLRPRRPLSLR